MREKTTCVGEALKRILGWRAPTRLALKLWTLKRALYGACINKLSITSPFQDKAINKALPPNRYGRRLLQWLVKDFFLPMMVVKREFNDVQLNVW